MEKARYKFLIIIIIIINMLVLGSQCFCFIDRVIYVTDNVSSSELINFAYPWIRSPKPQRSIKYDHFKGICG